MEKRQPSIADFLPGEGAGRVRIRFKGSKKDGGRGACRIHGELYEPGREYEVDPALAKWMVGRDLAERVGGEVPEGIQGIPAEGRPAEPATAYDKLMQAVGPHVVQVYGEAGTGKSRLVFAIASEAQAAGKKVLYLDTEGSLPPGYEDEIDHYEYIGPDLDALIKRARLAKQQRDQFDLLVVDSIGFPVLASYASLPLDKRLQAILSMTSIVADAIRFARASKHEKLPAPEKRNLAIITNQCVSEATRFAKGLKPEDPLEVFGGKIAFAPKLTVRSEVVERAPSRTVFRLVVHKSRNLPRGKEIARYALSDKGVDIEWEM